MQQAPKHKGPEVHWRADQIRSMVEALGREEAIRQIAEGIFLPEYVEKRVDEVLGLKDTESVIDVVIAKEHEVEGSEAA